MGASTNLSAEMGIYFQPGDQPVIDKYIADVRAQLDEATFETARAEGQAMTLKQAVTYALSDS